MAGGKLNELPAVVGKVALRAERLEADLAVQGVQLHPAGGVLFGGATDPAVVLTELLELLGGDRRGGVPLQHVLVQVRDEDLAHPALDQQPHVPERGSASVLQLLRASSIIALEVAPFGGLNHLDVLVSLNVLEVRLGI